MVAVQTPASELESVVVMNGLGRNPEPYFPSREPMVTAKVDDKKIDPYLTVAPRSSYTKIRVPPGWFHRQGLQADPMFLCSKKRGLT